MNLSEGKEIKASQKITLITKASGELEPFEPYKLENSLINAGASDDIIEEIINDINLWIKPGVSTNKIYRRAFNILHRRKNRVALYYKLKQAILELGPTGYPFEHLIGEIFKRQGFEVAVGQSVAGNCVFHEIDVIATKDKLQNLIECKYSENQGKQISIQVPLYVKSRVDDIIKKRRRLDEFKNYSFKGWLITNTRFSSDSITYSKCIGLKIISWDYPEQNGLKDIIEKTKIWPITILNNLTRKEKQSVMSKGIVTCLQLRNSIETISYLNLKRRKFKALIKELDDILY